MSGGTILRSGAAALGLELTTEQVARLERLLALLAKWNRTYNLTAIRGEPDMVTHHLLDSMSVAPCLGDARTLADVGSGAGFPGLVLAVLRPDLRIVSIEAIQKKVAFQQQARIELHLTNVEVVCSRAERVHRVFDAVISRAFASLADFVRLAGGLVAGKGRLLAMKGAYPADELSALPPGWRLVAGHPLAVPGLAAERHLIILERS
ncbi:MAG TPA: 16S rRNA (guanine(527)-N(7))-methyltransferase RsmG [Rhodocyclaceae bacterium]|nr:16S rRNA (guanine(527)-N(7))-methyltransferase RsmG [Rhodocyclaceae bacterium]HNH34556.1 16S rRNA (guanine(527)-N(7))-methyltransferase RsmG [Rhodocyclaceae bacterium]